MSAQRIYRTVDGRHVAEGHADAAFLAYTQYDEVPDDVAAEVTGKPKRTRRAKQATKRSDKQAAKPEDKGTLDDQEQADGEE